jgi:hypothetical protein
MIGPGKYDDLTTVLQQTTGAQGLVLVVVGGRLGSGFSCQTEHHDLLLVMARAMRKAADQMEQDYQAAHKAPGN